MSISGIPSSTFTQSPPGVPNFYQQTFITPPTTGGTSSTSSTSGTSSTSPSQIFNQLASDLQAGNIPAAQSDLSTLQLSLQSQSALINQVHNNLRSPSISPGELNQPPVIVNRNLIGQPASNTLLSQQQAYANLQAALQQFSLSGGTSSAQSTALLAQPPVSFNA